ncbi:MAG TPA: chorismate synthase [Candidatus Limiplasma sp.]|nr:chorismate synthase [Candidatus Limiplasma sp.]HPS80740.1 chorismate synthase [Candidatus Limiplasma sp.]
MSGHIGQALQVQIFGESHGAAVGATVDGLPAGLAIDLPALELFLQRRAAKGGELATGRMEADVPRILSGLRQSVTTGHPITAIFENADTHSSDYSFLPDRPRPGHADYPAIVKSAGHDDLRGSGHHSGRLTLAYAFAGGLALQYLTSRGIRVAAHVLRIRHVTDAALDPVAPAMDALEACRAQAVPTLDAAAGEAMRNVILEAKAKLDSVGGIVEVAATGLPVGLGAPFFDGVEAVAAEQFFSIPAVKGVEFGAGFAAAQLDGSGYNDPYAVEGGRIVTVRNNAGGLLGGLTNGMPVLARVAFRPTPSIGLPQQTVSLSGMAQAELEVRGRHDPCIVIRALPVVEGALALALADLLLQADGNRTAEVNHAR